ncbi:MAG: hypothetical protein IKJ01_07810, partial [Lachnospiraceae bacterium]|nr:hypothetical protein [Lachnospiraceae bacterium]
MMREGSTSANYIKQLIEQEHICVMKVGFIHKHEHLLTSILNRRKNNLHFVDIPLSAHAGYQGLVETIEKIEANCVIYVHGKGIDKG